MSSKDRKRAEATRMVMRSGHLVSKSAVPTEPEPGLYLKCGKCGHLIAESFVTEHLVGNEKNPGCQPAKTECGKCKQYIPSIDFMKHFKDCPGIITIPNKLEEKTIQKLKKDLNELNNANHAQELILIEKKEDAGNKT